MEGSGGGKGWGNMLGWDGRGRLAWVLPLWGRAATLACGEGGGGRGGEGKVLGLGPLCRRPALRHLGRWTARVLEE